MGFGKTLNGFSRHKAKNLTIRLTLKEPNDDNINSIKLSKIKDCKLSRIQPFSITTNIINEAK